MRRQIVFSWLLWMLQIGFTNILLDVRVPTYVSSHKTYQRYLVIKIICV